MSANFFGACISRGHATPRAVGFTMTSTNSSTSLSYLHTIARKSLPNVHTKIKPLTSQCGVLYNEIALSYVTGTWPMLCSVCFMNVLCCITLTKANLRKLSWPCLLDCHFLVSFTCAKQPTDSLLLLY